ncbi:MAG: ABC transporter ATP-binding protein [Anaerolineae bacterium]
MATPLFELENVRKRYGDREILTIGQLTVEPGEVLALVGPSGAGKSTLLRLLNFLESPTEGVLRYRGVAYAATQLPPLDLRRGIVTVFQRPVLLSRSVRDNVAYGLRLRGNRDGATATAQALADLGLAALADQPARTLSGGEMQRVSLARAVVLDPEVLLLDEPTANLDPYNVAQIEGIVRRHNQQHGATVVLVTHNVFQARRLADRVALLLDGAIVEVAPTHAFFASPHDRRTAAFVSGEMIY